MNPTGPGITQGRPAGADAAPSPLSDTALNAAAFFLGAFLLRALLYAVGGHRTIIGDEAIYWGFAHRLRDGGLSTSHFMPGWPFLLSLPLRLSDTLLTARIFNMLLGSAGCALAYVLAQRAFLDERKALWAGALFTLFPEHVFLSHYLYADIGLATILIALSLFAVSPSAAPERSRLVGAFLFGAAILFKHFAVLCFGAWLLVEARRAWRPWLAAPAMIAAFLVPLVLHGLIVGARQKDPLVALRSPIKSMHEWHINSIASSPRERSVTKVLGDFGSTLSEESPRYLYYRTYRSLRRLWGIEAIAAREIKQGRYAAWLRAPLVPFVIKSFYFIVLLAGVTGLFFSPPSRFRSYAALSLALLSAMSAQFFMVSRYRLAFMFFLIIFAAQTFAAPAGIIEEMKAAGSVRRWSWITLMTLLISNAALTWNL